MLLVFPPLTKCYYVISCSFATVKILDYLKPFISLLPEVSKPERKVWSKYKLSLSGAVALAASEGLNFYLLIKY